MNRKIIILKFLLLIVAVGYSQQDVQFTQYMYNMSSINPAYAGSHGTLSVSVMGRSQWSGLMGAPRTISASVNAPIRENMGLGMSIIADQIGPVKEENVYADYSYTIKTSDYGKLAFGLKAGVTFQHIDFFSLSLPEGDDPILDRDNLNEVYPNFGAGLFYYTENFYLGLSMPNFIETRHFQKTDGYISGASEKMHFYLSSGYVFDLKDDFRMRPSLMMRGTTGAPLSIEFSSNILYQDKFEVGVGWRVNESVSGVFNFVIAQDLRLGYAYDHVLANYGRYNSGSHEVFLLYDLVVRVKNSRSPRFF